MFHVITLFFRVMDRKPASRWISATETLSPTLTWALSRMALNTSTRTWESTECQPRRRTVWARKLCSSSYTLHVSQDMGGRVTICTIQTAISYSTLISLMYFKDPLGLSTLNSFMLYWPEKSNLALVVLHSTLSSLDFKLIVSNWTTRLESSLLVIADRHFIVWWRSLGPKISSRSDELYLKRSYYTLLQSLDFVLGVY